MHSSYVVHNQPIHSYVLENLENYGMFYIFLQCRIEPDDKHVDVPNLDTVISSSKC